MPAKFNQGWTYKCRVNPSNHGDNILDFLSSKYRHSSRMKWEERLRLGQIKINHSTTNNNKIINKNDLISWERPPWEEPSIPCSWEILFDDEDLLVINKPAGIPVIPGGGFFQHSLTEILRLKYLKGNNCLIPRPIHRLGRFTSGVLICAREQKSRSQLSSIFREGARCSHALQRIYRTLAKPNPILTFENSISITTPIQKQPHPVLGYIWNTVNRNKCDSKYSNLNHREFEAFSNIKLIERRSDSDLLEVLINTGRPHQIRIHLASLGTPLIGDPLYIDKNEVSQSATPGEGGYLLHSHKIKNIYMNNREYTFEALLPKQLQSSTEQGDFD